MAKLVYSNGAFTKSLSCIPPEAIDIDKPYIKVSGGGVIPLTTETHTGIKVNINGTPYSPASTVPVLYKTSVTETLSFYEGNIGTSGTSSITGTMSQMDVSCNGQFSSVDKSFVTYESTYKFYPEIIYEVIDFTGSKDSTTYANSDRDIWKASDKYIYLGQRAGSYTFINSKIKYMPNRYLEFNDSALPALDFRSSTNTVPFIIIGSSQSYSTASVKKASIFSYSDGQANTYQYTLNNIIMNKTKAPHWKLEYDTVIFTLGGTSRTLYRSGERTSQSITVSYMTNFLKTTLGGYTNSLNSFSVKERNSTWISASASMSSNQIINYAGEIRQVPSFTIIGDIYKPGTPNDKTATTISKGFFPFLTITLGNTSFYDKYSTNKNQFDTVYYHDDYIDNLIGTLAYPEINTSIVSGKITIGESAGTYPFVGPVEITMQHVSSIENLHASAPNQFFYSTSSSQTTTSYTVVRSSIATIYN